MKFQPLKITTMRYVSVYELLQLIYYYQHNICDNCDISNNNYRRKIFQYHPSLLYSHRMKFSLLQQ